MDENIKRLDIAVMERTGCSRTHARELIENGQVKVVGLVRYKPGSKLMPGDVLEILGETKPKFVSRGGYKLEKALVEFKIDVRGRICADIGASTGGFTDCLLKAGAEKVYAIDSGSGQLSQVLQNDRRVVSIEKTNIRTLDPDKLEKVSLAVVDVSFISLTKVLEHVKALVEEQGEIICLVKPQFEAGRQALNKKGIVKDIRIHEKVLKNINAYIRQIGLVSAGQITSPIKGSDGNTEYLILIKNAL